MKIKLMKDLEEQFKANLLKFHERRARNLSDRIKSSIENELNKTILPTQYGFQGARAKVDVDIISIKGRGVEVKVTASVVDPSGQPHRIWHYINDGQDYTIQRSKNVRIGNNQPRTTPHSYRWRAPNTDWKWRRLPAGKRIEVEGRRWYALVGKEVATKQMRRKGFADWQQSFKIKE